jgi:hypothetical protein
VVEGVNSSVIYLIYCKNLCKCHSVPPPNMTIKKEISLWISIFTNCSTVAEIQQRLLVFLCIFLIWFYWWLLRKSSIFNSYTLQALYEFDLYFHIRQNMVYIYILFNNSAWLRKKSWFAKTHMILYVIEFTSKCLQ